MIEDDSAQGRYLNLTTPERDVARGLARGSRNKTTTLANFLTHAEKYGTEGVFETAEDFLSKSELLQLAIQLDRIDGETRKKFAKRGRPKRLSVRQKIKAVDSMRAEDIPDSRIAKHLGVSERYVRKLASIEKKASGRERQPVRPGPGRPEHQHDRDDRKRADRNADRQRQDVADRLAHSRRSFSAPRKRASSGPGDVPAGA